MGLQLALIVVDGVLCLFEGHVHEGALEALFLDHVLHPLQMLLEPAGDGARLGGQLGVQEVEAALQRPLQQAAAIVAGAGRHVIGGHVRRGAAGRTQTHAEAAGQIQQHLRHEVAGVSQRQLPLVLRLLHQVVIGLLQQVLEINQMLQIPHYVPPSLRATHKAVFYMKIIQKCTFFVNVFVRFA